MNINISERALRWFGGVVELMQKIDIHGEIEYHISLHGQRPSRITIIRYYEDNDKLKPNKNHLILTI